MDNSRFVITMNEANKRFETPTGDEMAYIDYRWYQDTLVLLYVFVPEDHRGQGHSQALIEYALNYAKEKNIKVTVYCSYIARYMRLHPEYDFLLDKKAS